MIHAFQGQDTMQPWRVAWEKNKANPTLPLPLGRGCEIQPNGGVDFGEGCALECGIQLFGAVDFWAKTL